MKRICFVFLIMVLLLFSSPSLADEYITNVAGVTFQNSDGSERQLHLSKFYLSNRGPGYGSGSLRRYIYQGKPAIYVLLNGKVIGNIPADEVEKVLTIMDQIKEVSVYVNRFYPEENRLIYFARVEILYASAVSASPTPNSTPKKSTYTHTPYSDLVQKQRSSQGADTSFGIHRYYPYLIVLGFILLFLLVRKLFHMFSRFEFSFSKNNSYSKRLNILWIIFLWYAPFFPVIYLSLPLLESNSNHMIWVSAIFVFFSLFARVFFGDVITDIIVFVLYFLSFAVRFPSEPYVKSEVMLFLSATLYILYFCKHTLPAIFGNNTNDT